MSILCFLEHVVFGAIVFSAPVLARSIQHALIGSSFCGKRNAVPTAMNITVAAMTLPKARSALLALRGTP
jgi:hypothetical protein